MLVAVIDSGPGSSTSLQKLKFIWNQRSKISTVCSYRTEHVLHIVNYLCLESRYNCFVKLAQCLHILFKYCCGTALKNDEVVRSTPMGSCHLNEKIRLLRASCQKYSSCNENNDGLRFRKIEVFKKK